LLLHRHGQVIDDIMNSTVYCDLVSSMVIENSAANVLLKLMLLPLSQWKMATDRGLVIVDGGELARVSWS
jgi:hypothetical protein